MNFSSRLAHEARCKYIESIEKGEALMDMASAALHICSEDDALGTQQPLGFP